MVRFVVHEFNRFSKTISYIKIHRDNCGFAKTPNQETKSSFCHGYFDSFLEALNFAKSLDIETVRECHYCDPRHGYNHAIYEDKSARA